MDFFAPAVKSGRIRFLSRDVHEMADELSATFNVLKLQNNTTLCKLLSVKFADECTHIRQVRCGFVAECLLKNCVSNGTISEKQEMLFRKEAQRFVVTVVQKSLLKTLAGLKIVR